MHIVHLITRLIIGGAQENTVLSCEGLAARGHRVVLMTGPTLGPEGSLVERARRGAYAYEEIPDLVRQVSPTHDYRAYRALVRRFRELAPDVVHTHSSKAGVLGRLAAHRAGVPAIVHTIHGMSFNRTQSGPTRMAYAMAERFCAKRTHALVSVADAMTSQALAAGIGRPEQFSTIRSGIETEQFDASRHDGEAVRASWGMARDDVVVGTVARLFPNKGYEQLIEVMSRAVPREPRLRFVWIGDGSHRAAYETELMRRGLRDRVVLTGLLPPAEIPRVLSGIDVLAHTSQWEGLPRAVVQALLMGKPAVSFAIDGAPEVVVPGKTGELAALGDVQAFADHLVGLARDGERRRAYGQAGQALCRHSFDHRVMVQGLERLYGSLRGGRNALAEELEKL
jgi:glycosyltransferase involved in cell wall biosynthesis